MDRNAEGYSMIIKSGYLAFRQFNIDKYEVAINIIELIKSVYQAEITPCCEIYYGF